MLEGKAHAAANKDDMVYKEGIALVLLASSLGATPPAFANPPELESWQRNTAGTTGYAGILANVQAVQYTDDDVWVSATGIPSYTIGAWAMNPNVASDQALAPSILGMRTARKRSPPLGDSI